MAYITLHRGIPVKTAGIITGASDFNSWADGRPDMVNGG